MQVSKFGNEAYDLRNLELGLITVYKIRSCSACQGLQAIFSCNPRHLRTFVTLLADCIRYLISHAIFHSLHVSRHRGSHSGPVGLADRNEHVCS